MLRDMRFILKTHYSGSRALVIGINKYKHASPLNYAVSDASAIRDVLTSELKFPRENVTYLADEAATRQGILRAFLRFAKDDVDLDERLVVFYAGHGHTIAGSRGEIGFLVPHDADTDDLSTLIRWDELTRHSEVVRGKHVLFIMDACYGGLALTRHAKAGGTRFLKDMMLRHSRQVLTAGKADEVVSDSGGPIPDHSVFTGHLIEALQGKAASNGGVITASGVMAYVYNKVATDKNSNQTPHYGHFDGDGDLILKAPVLDDLEEGKQKDADLMLDVPPAIDERESIRGSDKVSRMKSLLSSNAAGIEIHDFLALEVRRYLSATSEDNFPMVGGFAIDEMLSRLTRYEEAVGDLSLLLACVTHWGREDHVGALQKFISRSCDRLEAGNGNTGWLALRWYPYLINLYCCGIAAVDAHRYDLLAAVFNAPLHHSDYRNKSMTFVEGAANGLSELIRVQVFSSIPGHNRHYTPHSEYLYKVLQPKLDDVFFLGKNYESAFDEFEILFSLAVADLHRVSDSGSWGPIGRFGWKAHSSSVDPLKRLIESAQRQKDAWPPLKAGLFGGSYQRFDEVAKDKLAGVQRLNWY